MTISQGESGTPFMLPSSEEGHPSVVAWRLGQLEQGVGRIEGKLERMQANYPTVATLSIILDPIKADVLALKQKNEDEEKTKNALSNQLKLAIFVSVLSPIMSIVVATLVAK